MFILKKEGKWWVIRFNGQEIDAVKDKRTAEKLLKEYKGGKK